jgi:hypothetical protein
MILSYEGALNDFGLLKKRGYNKKKTDSKIRVIKIGNNKLKVNFYLNYFTRNQKHN